MFIFLSIFNLLIVLWFTRVFNLKNILRMFHMGPYLLVLPMQVKGRTTDLYMYVISFILGWCKHHGHDHHHHRWQCYQMYHYDHMEYQDSTDVYFIIWTTKLLPYKLFYFRKVGAHQLYQTIVSNITFC